MKQYIHKQVTIMYEKLLLYSETKVMIYRKLMISLNAKCSVSSHHGIPLSVIQEKISISRVHQDMKLQSVSWILAEFYFNRGLQRLYTGTCIILKKQLTGFFVCLLFFLKVKRIS